MGGSEAAPFGAAGTNPGREEPEEALDSARERAMARARSESGLRDLDGTVGGGRPDAFDLDGKTR
jgi:hypothetical protein